MKYCNVFLDNDKSISYYGVPDEGEILLFNDPYQGSTMRKEADIADLEKWLASLNTDFENGIHFMRSIDYIVAQIREHENKPYPLAYTEVAMQYVRKCYDSTHKLKSLVIQLTNKYTALSTEFERYFIRIQENHNRQVDFQNRMLFSKSRLICRDFLRYPSVICISWNSNWRSIAKWGINS